MAYKTINGKLVKVRKDALTKYAPKEAHDAYDQALTALEYIKTHSDININKIIIKICDEGNNEFFATYDNVQASDQIKFETLLQQYFTSQGLTQVDEYDLQQENGKAWGQNLDEMFPGSKITQH